MFILFWKKILDGLPRITLFETNLVRIEYSNPANIIVRRLRRKYGRHYPRTIMQDIFQLFGLEINAALIPACLRQI
jgi:hypothetical protein